MALFRPLSRFYGGAIAPSAPTLPTPLVPHCHWMGPTFSLAGCHILIGWVPHSHCLGATFSLAGCHILIGWVPHSHWLGTTFSLAGYHILIGWVPHSHWLGATFSLAGCHILIDWVPHSHWLGATLLLAGCHILIGWVPHTYQVHRRSTRSVVAQLLAPADRQSCPVHLCLSFPPFQQLALELHSLRNMNV